MHLSNRFRLAAAWRRPLAVRDLTRLRQVAADQSDDRSPHSNGVPQIEVQKIPDPSFDAADDRLGLATFVASAQSDRATQAITPRPSSDKGSATARAFVLRQNEKGETICRLATPAERRRIMQRRGDSHVIYAGAPRAGDKSQNGANAALPNLQPSAGFRIVLHGTAHTRTKPDCQERFHRRGKPLGGNAIDAGHHCSRR